MLGTDFVPPGGRVKKRWDFVGESRDVFIGRGPFGSEVEKPTEKEKSEVSQWLWG